MHRIAFRALIMAAALLAYFCLPSIASADGVTFDLTNVTLSDGETASGSFVFDETTHAVSNVDITLSDGTVFLAANPGSGPMGSYLGSTLYQVVFVPSASSIGVGTPVLILYSVTEGFPNLGAGSEIPLSGGFSGEYACGNATCSTPGAELLSLTGDVTNAPEPSSLLLLGLGLAGLMVVGTRRAFQA
jgi:hypothetical protein